MKINNLLMNSNMLDKISADILKIDKNKNDLFYNRFQEEVNLDSIKNGLLVKIKQKKLKNKQ